MLVLIRHHHVLIILEVELRHASNFVVFFRFTLFFRVGFGASLCRQFPVINVARETLFEYILFCPFDDRVLPHMLELRIQSVLLRGRMK